MRWLSIVVVLAVGLAGCGRGTIVYDRDYGRLHMSVTSAATGGLQPVEIAGTPPGGASPEAVASALRVPGQFQETRYQAVPAGSGGLRLVLEFGQRIATRESCVEPSGADLDDRLTVAASLCRGEDLISTATLTDAPVVGPEDPRFADSLELLLQELLTDRTPRKRSLFLRGG